MNRHESREKAMICVYQYLIFKRDIDQLLADNFHLDDPDVDQYAVAIVRQAVDNAARYEGYINQVLEGWSFDRLGYIEQAILLNGCAEFDLKKTEAAVIIDESIRMAKKFCDADTYKLINGVLDTL